MNVPDPTPHLPHRGAARTRLRELGMGAEFALRGGREGWIRTLLTTAGVALGVALMLLTTALPSALDARDSRTQARGTLSAATAPHSRPDTVLVGEADTTFRTLNVYGRVLQPEGPRAPLPPGLKRFPAPGELAVSPALRELLASPGGRLLRERLAGRISATIGDAGLVGPGELAYYQGSDQLHPSPQVRRLAAFGNAPSPRPLDPTLMLLLVVAVTGLLIPVAAFIATAVRFGGERRDRRLAALRLLGTDRATTRWIAAGESLTAALMGEMLGAASFFLLRGIAGETPLTHSGVFAGDLAPVPWMAALVAVAVPAAAVALTLFAMRTVSVEPLGVFRTGKPLKRRVWWRLLLPIAGLGLLAPMAARGGVADDVSEARVVAGVFLLLIGISALMPWVVETVVSRLGGGGVSWHLAVRRLQTNSGTSVRLVNGIAVAVAAAITLNMLFTGVETKYTHTTGQDPSRATLSVPVPVGPGSTALAEDITRRFATTEGVTKAIALMSSRLTDTPEDPASPQDRTRLTTPRGDTTQLTVGTCAALREIAALPSCTEGDTFVVRKAVSGTGAGSEPPAPGTTLYADPAADVSQARQPVRWTLPRSAKTVDARPGPDGSTSQGVLATPQSVPRGLSDSAYASVYVQTDPAVPDALDRARTAAFLVDPTLVTITLQATTQVAQFTAIRTGTSIGVVLVLLLIGAGLLISQLERLRERRKLLSTLTAFGTPRPVLGLSALWEAAVPIALGTALATGTGLTLGSVLMAALDVPVAVDWAFVGLTAAVSTAVVLLVTALTLPPLLRMARPEHLRTE